MYFKVHSVLTDTMSLLLHQFILKRILTEMLLKTIVNYTFVLFKIFKLIINGLLHCKENHILLH